MDAHIHSCIDSSAATAISIPQNNEPVHCRLIVPPTSFVHWSGSTMLSWMESWSRTLSTVDPISQTQPGSETSSGESSHPFTVVAWIKQTTCIWSENMYYCSFCRCIVLQKINLMCIRFRGSLAAIGWTWQLNIFLTCHISLLFTRQ